MGLGNSGSGKVFIRVINGKLAIRVKEGTSGAIQRILTAGDNEGKVVYEQHYKFLEGKITKLSYEVKSFGAFIEIEVDDKYVLSVPFKSSMKRNIVSQLPNVNFALPVKIMAFQDKETSKNVLLIHQNDVKVKFAHTKDNPNGMPTPVEKVELGQKIWDYSAIEEFMYNTLLVQIARFNQENGIEVESDEPDPSEFE